MLAIRKYYAILYKGLEYLWIMASKPQAPSDNRCITVSRNIERSGQLYIVRGKEAYAVLRGKYNPMFQQKQEDTGDTGELFWSFISFLTFPLFSQTVGPLVGNCNTTQPVILWPR